MLAGLPFAVRTVQPVLMDLDPLAEEAAAVLGASRLFTFRKIILRANACKDAIYHANGRGFRGNITTNLGHEGDQRNLAQVG